MAAKRQMGFRCRLVVVLLLLLGSIAAIIAVAVIQDTWRFQEYNTEYGIVIDSGSSRSTVYLYEWPGEKKNETGVVKEVLHCRVAGNGISDMGVDPVKDAASWKGFKACMVNVTENIPPEKHNKTPLFLGATAGMRLLQMEDEKRSNEVLANLRKYLGSLPFMFQNASIISGQEEGLYGWITVNYLMGNFLERHLWNTHVNPHGAETVGSMDLGGASTQIAFAVQEDLRGDDYLQVRLYGYPYNVYTHSFLCYGKNEMDKRIQDKVIKQSQNRTYVYNPCYAEGYNTTTKASVIYNSQCTQKPEDYNPDQDIVMVGDPDADKCVRIVRSLFDFKNCSSASCSFNGVEQPPVTGDFMAYAGFYYIARAMLLSDTSVDAFKSELDEFKSAVEKFCQTHWTVLTKEKHWVSERHLKTYCYTGHYVLTLLANGYKFDTDTWKNIAFQRQVKDTSVGWSLGYMLSMSNMIPSEARDVTPMASSVFAGLIFLFSALTIVTMVLLLIMFVRTCY
ncbi:ectonucleoside triphosphate diphosphohydrolase 3 [Myripristis murdjan]|uniref:ectonucleoside triphosphate diphosphohydrolase 3 n=1 Tax=Myripristis murdjan TaxID=586833 RepID=UPI0011763E22|nr:ectonucleoside triphosphate diphosphohydrolase 3 [Myripristis murdjan]